MIRLQYIFWPAIILALALVLFQVKQGARTLEQDVRRLNGQIESTEQSIEVLRAEWSHLNQPGYLKSLAMRHLDYTGEQQTVIGKISDLPKRSAPLQRSSAVGETRAPSAQTLPAPTAQVPEATGSFRHVTDIDLIGAMISSQPVGEAGQILVPSIQE